MPGSTARPRHRPVPKAGCAVPGHRPGDLGGYLGDGQQRRERPPGREPGGASERMIMANMATGTGSSARVSRVPSRSCQADRYLEIAYRPAFGVAGGR